MVSYVHVKMPTVPKDLCRRMKPQSWICGCRYSEEHILGLPNPFVRQCGDDLLLVFSHFQVYGETIAPSCTDLQLDESPLPWLCPNCHDRVFGSAGGLNAFSGEVIRECSANSNLPDEVVPLKNARLPQMEMLKEAWRLLQKAPESSENIQAVVLRLREVAMREYLGFWWYYRVWKKSALVAPLPSTSESSTEQPEPSATEPRKPASDPNAPRPWLTAPTTPLYSNFDPATLLEAFDYRHDNASHWAPFPGYAVSPTIHIARHMRQLLRTFASLVKPGTSATDVFKAARIRDLELPDFALLLSEQALLEKSLNDEIRKRLQVISDTHLELLSEQAGSARKEAAVQMLQTPLRIWRSRFKRYERKILEIPAVSCEKGCVMLQVVPESITDFVHGDEPVVS